VTLHSVSSVTNNNNINNINNNIKNKKIIMQIFIDDDWPQYDQRFLLLSNY